MVSAEVGGADRRDVSTQDQIQNLPNGSIHLRQEAGICVPEDLGDGDPKHLCAPGVNPSNKEEVAKPQHEEENLETEQAHIERLGRERPAKFKSFGAELAFCYSIIASQFMAVGALPRLSSPYPI